ncbi:MAG: aminomethyl-transferring glycine dehydrogenase subunit GcvPA [Chloroflexota bacterium]
MNYLPSTPEDRAAMLASLGLASTDELFNHLPRLLPPGALDLPDGISELELVGETRRMAAANANLQDYDSFLGAGAYQRFVPAVVGQLAGRAEFYTAYTPYQPEISQGTLQTIYEYQSLICELTGMDAANASMYEGATALAEAALMASRATGRQRVVVLDSVHPEYREVLKTYAAPIGLDVVEVRYTRRDDPHPTPRLPDLSGACCLIAQNPNFFGHLEDMERLAGAAHAAGALFVASVDPISLGLLKSPAEYGADIVTGEGQGLGNPISFGGPYLGIFACREQHLRRMPGRLVGATTDSRGRRGFVLTLQAREQHIRRERATSNICTNQALNALYAALYLISLGKQGLREVANLCLQKSHYLAEHLPAGYHLKFATPFFQEMAVQCPCPPAEINARLLKEHVIGGAELGRWYPELEDCMLLCTTEMVSREAIDRLLAALACR